MKETVVRVEFDIPERIELTIDQSTIVPVSDPAASFGYQSTARISVIAYFSGARSLDITHDTKWISISFSPANRTTISGNEISIIGVTVGTVWVNVTYNFFNLSTFYDSKSVTVARSRAISLSLRPYPVFPGSESTSVSLSKLYPGTSIRQDSLLDTSLILTNDDSVSITSSASYTVSDASLVSIDGSIVKPVAVGGVVIVAFYASFNDSQSLSIEDNVLATVSFVANPDSIVSGTLVGVVNSITSAVGNATFSDSTTGNTFEFVDLFPSGVPILPGFVQFSTDDPSIISIDANTGEITLLQNSINQMATITATAPGAANFVTTVFSNLVPEIGDVDFGNELGLAIPPVVVS